MFSHLGKLEIRCDAPPYSVVEACEYLGFQSPPDVRWLKLSQVLEKNGQTAWKAIFGSGRSKEITCSCRHPLPILEKYTFTFVTQEVADYFLGQCPRCRTIFWEEG